MHFLMGLDPFLVVTTFKKCHAVRVTSFKNSEPAGPTRLRGLLESCLNEQRYVTYTFWFGFVEIKLEICGMSKNKFQFVNF